MKLGLINSAWAQAGRDTAFGIRMTKEIGFDTIDIFADPLDIDAQRTPAHPPRVRQGRPADRQRRLRRRRPDRLQPQRAALPPRALPALPRPGLRVRGQEPAAGAGRIHLGAAGDSAGRAVADRRPQRPRAGQVRRRPRPADRPGAGAVQAVAGQQRGQHGALPRRREPSGGAGQHRRFAPAAVAARRPEELRRLKGKAIHVHISDCDGKVHGDLPPGRGVVDFAPYLREIKALGIDGAVSIELEYSPQPERIVEWVREAYEATDRLMREAGLRG